MTEPLLSTVTGLPEVPDGYFWRVSPVNERGAFEHHGPKFRLALVAHRDKRVTFLKVPLWMIREEHTVLTEDIFRYRGIRPDKLEGEDRYFSSQWEAEHSPAAKETIEGWPHAVVVVARDYSEYYVVDNHLDDESILRHAKSIWQKLEDSRQRERELEAERLRTSAYVGDYPPKSIKK